MNFKEYLEYNLPMAGKDKIVVLSTTEKVDVIDKEEFDKFKENKTKIFKNLMEE